ncbi:MAG: hypothetical protein M1839_007697 [Geoglossum umbratile]|nr:MAG: hypothetical protein M1839_007697 [Geoglossum umbratile]
MADILAGKTVADIVPGVALDDVVAELPRDKPLASLPGGVEGDQDLSKWETMKQNTRAIFWSTFALFTCILWGYDGLAGNIVVGIPQFRQDFGVFYENQWVIPAEWLLGFNGGGMASE